LAVTFILVHGVPVIVSRDNYDLAVLWATVIATPLAAVGILLAAWTIRSGNRDRWRVFELDVLTKLLDTCALAPPGSIQRAKALIAMLGPHDLPGLRQEIGRDTLPSNDQLEPFLPEFIAAARKRAG
jgi:hypothetical protein